MKTNGVSSAEIKDGAVRGPEVDESSLGQVPSAATLGGLGAGAFQQRIPYAVVEADGSVIAQSGGLQVTKESDTGEYLVNFGRNVANSALLVTPESGGFQGGAAICGGPPGIPCNTPGADNRNHALVDMRNSIGDPANTSFYIAAIGG